MSVSDALLVGEGWISEHYFSSDAKSESFHARVAKRRKSWDELAKEGHETPRSRLLARRSSLGSQFSFIGELVAAAGTDGKDVRPGLAAPASQLADVLLDILQIRGLGRVVTQDGPLLRVALAGVTDRHPLVIVQAVPQAELEDVLAKDSLSLFAPTPAHEGGDEVTSAARLTSALFVDENDAPDLVLILAGPWLVLAEKERWPEGRYLAVNLQLVCERNNDKVAGEIDRALTCLSGESIAPDADGNLWWHEVFTDSVKHTVGVSKELREGVRESIELIANEVVRRRRDQELDPLPADQAQELAVVPREVGDTRV